jgi:uncharacterized protein (DUF488 family)
MMSKAIYTIGHSTHSSEYFVQLLKKHSITAVCDVRSKPYSRMNPQFNRESLKETLASSGIKYVFLGEELGARTEDRSCYCNGKVQYELLAKTELFKKGIDRVKKGADEYRVALMCAEKEPLDCHRTILVSRILSEDGIPIRHILGNGTLEEHSRALKRLIMTLKVPSSDMFRSEEVVIEDAYTQQGHQIAYQEQSTDGSSANDQLHYDESGAAE